MREFDDLEIVELGATAFSLVPEVQTIIKEPHTDERIRLAVNRLFETRLGLIDLVAFAKESGQLEELAPTVGHVGRALIRAELLMLSQYGVFNNEVRAALPRLKGKPIRVGTLQLIAETVKSAKARAEAFDLSKDLEEDLLKLDDADDDAADEREDGVGA